MNLLTDKWIQVRDYQGTSSRIAPCDIVGKKVYLDFPRSDFNLSVNLFLIGIVQLYRSQSTSKPNTPQELYKVVSQHSKAFEMDGPTPFMQDPNLVNNPLSILSILVDSPGEKTVKDRRDFFRKQGSMADMCPSCATAALYTLQMFAYPGGAGSMQSPLCNAVIALKFQESAWDLVWENSLPHSEFSTYGNGMKNAKGADVFPWLTVCGTLRILSDIPAEHLHWIMPWRVKITIEDREGACGCCGEHANKMVSSFHKAPRGISYRDLIHPFLLRYTITNKKGTQIHTVSLSGRALKHNVLSDILYNKAASPTMTSPTDLVVSGVYRDQSKYFCWMEKQLYFDPSKAALVSKMLKAEKKARELLSSCSTTPGEDKDFSLSNQVEESLESAFYDILRSNKGIEEWTNEVAKCVVNAFDRVAPRYIKWKGWFCSELKRILEKISGSSVNVPMSYSKTRVNRLSGKAEIQVLKWWSWITRYDKKLMHDMKGAASWEEVQSSVGFTTLFNKLAGILYPQETGGPNESFLDRLSLAVFLATRLKGTGPGTLPRVSGNPFDKVSDLEMLVVGQRMNVISIFNSILFS